MQHSSNLWWMTDSYDNDTAVPDEFESWAGPNGIALVKLWPNGKTDANYDANVEDDSRIRSILSSRKEEERKRREAEARAQEAARKEQEKLRAQAEKAAAKGKTERAEALTAAAESIVAPVFATSVPKIPGLSTRKTKRAEVTSKTELIRGVVSGATPEAAVEPNMTFLNNQARAMGDTLAYPGVKVVEEAGIASKTA